MRTSKTKKWYEYLWIASSVYLVLGIFNILFAWLGIICFITPLVLSLTKKDKLYCNRYCGRSQLFDLLGRSFSRQKKPPRFLRSSWFRYGFLAFFMSMFILMLVSTYRVFAGAPLKETVTLLWIFRLPWHWTDTQTVSPWIAQFAFGFYSIMLTSTILGFITMILYKPRTWCVYCPMGSMTQGICKLKYRKEWHEYGRTSEKDSGITAVTSK